MGDRLFELHSPEISRLALVELITRARSQPSEPLPALSEATLRLLRDPQAEAMISRLLGMNAVRVLLNAQLLNFRCEHLDMQQFEDAALQYFINAQASNPLIRRCFPGVGRRHIERVRKSLSVTPPVRAQQVPEALGYQIYRVWLEICRETVDIRERYIALHGEFPQWSLTTLHAALSVDEEA